MSWKQWDQGEIVEAGDFQEFIQDQVVQSYANDSERNTTLGTAVKEGMISYREDANVVEVYDGSQWVRVGEEGDITAVTAGTALTGGGTSGDVTLDVDIAAVGSAVSIEASQISDVTATAAELNILDGVTADATELNLLDGVTATTAELNFTDGVTSNIQTQLDDKQDDVITTEGDLVTGDASGDPIRLAIGTADQVLTSDGTALTWADSSAGGDLTGGTAGFTALSNGTAGLSYQPVSHNYIINGAFDIWQRGDSFTNLFDDRFTADRWNTDVAGASGTLDEEIKKQTFTPSDLEVLGFGESEYYLRWITTDPGSRTRRDLRHKIEDVRTLAGQTVTLSFYAKADASRNYSWYFGQNFGSGGSGEVDSSIETFSLTTSWQRFSATFTLPSVSGKTIGGSSYLFLRVQMADVVGEVFDLWGVQLEAGSIATPFKRNANSIAGELQACQRYFQRVFGLNKQVAIAACTATNGTRQTVFLPVPLRQLNSFDSDGLRVQFNGFNTLSPSSSSPPTATLDDSNVFAEIRFTGDSSPLTVGEAAFLSFDTSGDGYMEFDGEL